MYPPPPHCLQATCPLSLLTRIRTKEFKKGFFVFCKAAFKPRTPQSLVKVFLQKNLTKDFFFAKLSFKPLTP
jgi:hypothetical protein